MKVWSKFLGTLLVARSKGQERLYFSSLFLNFFLMFIYFWERGGYRIQSRLQALSCQHRAQRGARSHELWDHDLSRSQTLNRLSPPGTAMWCFLINNRNNLCGTSTVHAEQKACEHEIPERDLNEAFKKLGLYFHCTSVPKVVCVFVSFHTDHEGHGVQNRILRVITAIGNVKFNHFDYRFCKLSLGYAAIINSNLLSHRPPKTKV